MDTISTGVSVGFAMECYEKGLLSEEDTEGMELTFGSGEALLETIDRITRREGVREVLEKI